MKRLAFILLLIPILAGATERIYQRNSNDLILGTGVENAQDELIVGCMRGEADYNQTKQVVIYRLRPFKSDWHETKVVAEMVVLTGEMVLQNPEHAVKFKGSEFARKCGSAYISKVFSGIRLAKSFTVSNADAAKLPFVEMVESENSTVDEFAKVIDQHLVEIKSIRVIGFQADGFLQGPNLGDVDRPLADVFREFRSKPLDEIMIVKIEGETTLY